MSPELHTNDIANSGSRRLAQLAKLEAQARAANKAIACCDWQRAPLRSYRVIFPIKVA
jgi:hypothetical protein